MNERRRRIVWFAVLYTAGPGEWENMDWEQWNVSGLAGQTAQIRIVDTAPQPSNYSDWQAWARPVRAAIRSNKIYIKLV